MNKQQQTALNMARFIKSQSLTLLEKLDALDADEQAAMGERLHELAEKNQNRSLNPIRPRRKKSKGEV
ncbi:Rop family plasmid primer RNA-binding protein [Klebsiella pneumoniae]|uniref:Rop family plasmid primer RNA-binding protein n=1 Tax=Klebsiella pneumoniae TaxID=573 RepID=UPI001F4BA3F3